MLLPICRASSLVGARMSARGLCGLGFGLLASAWSVGRRNAAVFPVPVCAIPIMSCWFSAWGIACSWIGVGCV